MINRIAYHFRHVSHYPITGGVIMLLFNDWRIFGMYAIAGGAVFYLFFHWIYQKTIPKQTYEADENGHAKPNYR